jgi:hypothetical protein
MSDHEHEHVSDEEIDEEIEKAREDEAGADEPQPWAKTSSGDADHMTSDS